MTVKDLQAINEILRLEMHSYKKCCNYVAQTDCPNLKEKLGFYANNHKTRFENLEQFLNSQN